MATFFDLLTPAQQADVAALGVDFNHQVGEIVQANSNRAANVVAQQKLSSEARITQLLPNITPTQLGNLQAYLQTLGLNVSSSVFQQLTPAQLLQVITIITT